LIYSLTGTISEKRPDFVALDVHGVTYGVTVPLTTYQQIRSIGESLTLHTVLIHREDRMELYGFAGREDREIFKLLISLQGIGPKLAIVLLSNLTPAELKKNVYEQNIDRLKRISGIGPKKAEKILFELKDKLKATDRELAAADGTGVPSVEDDLYLALLSLGYNSSEAARAMSHMKVKDAATLEDKIKESLRLLSR
jgi:holliday junction DNA helicase RuvA